MFDKLEIKQYKIKDDSNNKYLVYKDKTNFVEVFADTAGEAVEKSQVPTPYQIIHYNPKSKLFFKGEDLVEVANTDVDNEPIEMDVNDKESSANTNNTTRSSEQSSANKDSDLNSNRPQVETEQQKSQEQQPAEVGNVSKSN